jgi:hypothetical protein
MPGVRRERPGGYQGRSPGGMPVPCGSDTSSRMTVSVTSSPAAFSASGKARMNCPQLPNSGASTQKSRVSASDQLCRSEPSAWISRCCTWPSGIAPITRRHFRSGRLTSSESLNASIRCSSMNKRPSSRSRQSTSLTKWRSSPNNRTPQCSSRRATSISARGRSAAASSTAYCWPVRCRSAASAADSGPATVWPWGSRPSQYGTSRRSAITVTSLGSIRNSVTEPMRPRGCRGMIRH